MLREASDKVGNRVKFKTIPGKADRREVRKFVEETTTREESTPRKAAIASNAIKLLCDVYVAAVRLNRTKVA